MSPYCLKCRKNTENINPKVVITSNDKIILLSKYAMCSSKKSRCIKKTRSKRNIK